MAELPMADEQGERCETCRFWSRQVTCNVTTEMHDPGQAIGLCRIRAPRIVDPEDFDSLSEVWALGKWPAVWYNEWCGEWQAKVTPEKVTPEKVTPRNPALDLGLESLDIPNAVLVKLCKGWRWYDQNYPRDGWSPTCKTLGTLVARSYSELLQLRHIGKSSLDTVQRALLAHGLKLAPG